MRRVLVALIALVVLALPGVAFATPGPSDAPEWWFDSWQVPSLWAGGADGRGITVAVIDTGVQASRTELAGKVLPGADYIGNGSDGRTDYDTDVFSHGTAMASIIAAAPGTDGIEGLAPAVKILPIAVPLRGVTRTGAPITNATAKAIDFAADHGARIISMSLGGVRDESDGPDPCPGPVQDAVVHALAKGAIVVAASGNSGTTGNPVEEPGVCLGVVSVGSVNKALTASTFSSRHPYLTVSAPGEYIPSLGRETDSAFYGLGTSQATALTSASLALIWSKYPAETSRQVLTRLLTTVTDRGPAGRDSAYGLGVINPEAAIAARVPATAAANPVLDGVAPLLALVAQPATQPKAVAAGTVSSPLGTSVVGTRAATLSGAFLLLTIGAGGFVLLAVASTIALLRRRKPLARY